MYGPGPAVDLPGLQQLVAAAVTTMTRGPAIDLPGALQAAGAAAPGAGSLSIYAISLLP